MSPRRTVLIGVLAAGIFAPCTRASVSAQGQITAAKAAPAKATSWVVPRTADGQPDLQGVWANNVATPLQRPQALVGKSVLTPDELAALKSAAAEIFNGDGDAAFGDSVFEAALARAKSFTSIDGKTGDYNHFWLPDRDFENRTSLITDPADGRIPPLTEEAQRKAAARPEPSFDNPRADTWEDRSLSERCITFGSPRLGAGYNSYYQIIQNRDVVVIAMETIHDARIIPLDGRPHVGANIRQWLGDSRGHWEGDTLVVDTRNYSPKSRLMGSTENLHVTERFTRVGADTIKYEATFDDPTTWVRPWTAMIPLKRAAEQIYEYACHEGNDGLEGILAGARAAEKEQSRGVTSSGSPANRGQR
jgi:hypothetical protein